jgi:hypothetical protein
LLLHTPDNPIVPVEHGRYLATHIAEAAFVELRGAFHDHGSKGAAGAIFDEIALSFTGERPEVEVDRILTTVLFTDNVGSTERAYQMGDRAWRSLLDAHDKPCVQNSDGSEAARSIRQETDSSLPSTDRAERFVARGRSSRPRLTSASTSDRTTHR